MSFGLLNNISAIYAGGNLDDTQTGLQKVLQQLSSGSRINSGADDAAGLAVADGLKANEASLTQSVQNAYDGIGLLQIADGALSQVTNLLDRAVTLATEVASGTLSSNQVSSANQEYQSILIEISNVGGTTDLNGNPVFGPKTTAFYVGDGTSAGSSFYSDTIGALNISSVGQSAPASQAAVLAPTVVDLHNMDSPAIAATNGVAGTTNASATYTYAPGALVSGAITFTDGATGGVQGAMIIPNSTVTGAAAQLNANVAFATVYHATSSGQVLTIKSLTRLSGTAAGSGVDTGQAAAAGIQTYNLANANDTLSGTIAFQQGALNMSTSFAPGTTLQQAVAQINAPGSPFQAAGITAAAYVPGATQPNPLNILLNGGFENGLSSWSVDLASNVSNTIAHTGSQSVELTGGRGYGGLYQVFAVAPGASYTVGGWFKVPAYTSASYVNWSFYDAAYNNISSSNTAYVSSNGNWAYVSRTVTAPSNAVTMLIQPFAGYYSGLVYADDISVVPDAAESGAATLVLTNTNTGVNLSNYSTNTGTLLLDTAPAGPLGAGTDFTSSALATLTSGSAQSVLTGVNSAIANVAYQRGILGAYSNELTAASNTAASENVNLTSAESSIRSTNYGQATSNLAKYEVLSQTGISALAQANTVQQEILRLLQ